MLAKRMEIAQVFANFQDHVETGLGRAQVLALIADGLVDKNPDVARALAALACDMVEDKTRTLGLIERLIDSARAGEVTGSIEF